MPTGFDIEASIFVVYMQTALICLKSNAHTPHPHTTSDSVITHTIKM